MVIFSPLNFGLFRQISCEDSHMITVEQISNAAKKTFKRLLNKVSYADERISFDIKIEPTAENFENIIRAFEELENAKTNFLVSLPKWSHSRKICISQLRIYAKEVELNRRNCNYTKAGSFSVGIVSGAMCISAFIFPSRAATFTTAGLIIVGLSGATTVGTSITEMLLFNKCMQKVKPVQETDQDNFKPMTQWFEHSAELTNLMDQTAGFSLTKEVFQDLKDCRTSIDNLLLNNDGKLHPLLKKIVDRCVDKLTTAGKKKVLIAFVFFVLLLHRKNNLLLSCIVASQRMTCCLMKILDLGSGLGMAISNIAMKSRAFANREVTEATAKTIAQGFVFGLGLVLDTTNLIIISKDIHRGTNSKKAEEINTVADGLESELEVLESIYKKLGGEPFEHLAVYENNC